MSDRIFVVTAPDDTLLQGIRIINVCLNEEQASVVSASLLKNNTSQNIISYVWQTGNPLDWLFDKIAKCDLIIFNADSPADMIIGWISAQPQSYYFGNLRDLHMVNDHVIYNIDDILNLLEKVSKKYE